MLNKKLQADHWNEMCYQLLKLMTKQKKENHREEEDQEGNNSPEIETLPLFPIHGGSRHDFFGVKASDLSSDHSVGGHFIVYDISEVSYEDVHSLNPSLEIAYSPIWITPRVKFSSHDPIIHMESSATREYSSLIHTFFLRHTVGGVFLNPEDKALYDEMLRLQGLGSNTPTGVPYTEDEIMAIVRGGKQRGHIPGVGRVLPGQGTVIPPPPPCTHTSDVVKLKKSEKRLTRQVNMFMKLFRSDDKFSQMLTQLESQPKYGGVAGVAGAGMMSREMMRTATRMRRMPIVRRCWVNIDLYLADNASFVTSSPVL
ncbi:hypothetical protein Tco_0954139 [Tanacetum coccineum]|uniref:Uncharacterized protein n=1 Tax=Tanacetum coccineum TaxID=301880 RepID=A0ABQ5E2V9_9ASTR